jgi:uroporphyrinogen-III synthase
MTILLTRPIEDSQKIANELKKLGIGSEISPLLEIKKKLNVIPDQEKYQAIILTSKHAVLGLIDTNIKKSMPIYCVGDATSSFVVNLGFLNVVSASGDAGDLTRLTIKNLTPSEGPILYLCGQHANSNINDKLELSGFTVVASIVYEAKEIKSLSKTVVKSLKKKEISGVFLYSPRSARILCNVIECLNLQKTSHGLVVYCLSSAVANEVKSLIWKDVLIAQKPNNLEMLALVGEYNI